TLLSQPYFTTDYVSSGPFRLVDWGLGQSLIFERYDDYFLGRPRVGRVIIQVFADQNALLANLKAGAIDVVAEKTLLPPLVTELRNEWAANGEGAVGTRQENWFYAQFQHDPQWARPSEIASDVRIRRGLAEATDRASLADFLFPG